MTRACCHGQADMTPGPSAPRGPLRAVPRGRHGAGRGAGPTPEGAAHVFPEPMCFVAPADPSHSSEGWRRRAKRALDLGPGSLGLGPGPWGCSATVGQEDRAGKRGGNSLRKGRVLRGSGGKM